VVVATGMATEMGRIAGMLSETPDEPAPLQEELDRVGKRLGLFVIVIAVVMIGTVTLFEHVRGWLAILDVLIFGIALAVAAVPERPSGTRDGHSLSRRAADGKAQCLYAPPPGSRDARGSERHRVR
jgi:hypothetical protein